MAMYLVNRGVKREARNARRRELYAKKKVKQAKRREYIRERKPTTRTGVIHQAWVRLSESILTRCLLKIPIRLKRFCTMTVKVTCKRCLYKVNSEAKLVSKVDRDIQTRLSKNFMAEGL